MTIRRVVTNGGSFDSRLGYPRMQDNQSILTLIVKVFLNQRNPAGGAATGTLRDSGEDFAIAKWTAQEWPKFKEGVRSVVDQVWDGQLFLKPPAKFPAKMKADFVTSGPSSSKNPPYVACNLDVVLSKQARGSHVELQCYRLADSETKTFRSYIEPRAGRDGGVVVNRDVSYEVYHEGGFQFRFFNTIAHEIGHVLGLNHPLGPGNEAAKYGAPGTPEYREVMGFGTNVTVRQATPWLNRIKLHTSHTQTWTATTTRPTPQFLGIHFPLFPSIF